MSHPAQRDFISILAGALPKYFSNADVLEVGSLNINGTVRDFFSECRYLGIDVGAGTGVDIVCPGQEYDAPDNSFDHVLSCEVMEHNPYWQQTFKNMVRMCRPGGLVTMSCATIGRPEHGTTRSSPTSSPLTIGRGWEYYTNLRESDFRRAVEIPQLFSHHKFWVNWKSFDLYFIGIKSPSVASAQLESAWADTLRALDEYASGVNGTRSSKYRAIAARAGGDWYFEKMRALGNLTKWLHEP